eukprot:s3772_g6.t1
MCDGVADRFGDHSRTCPCGGDRTKRHNCLRAVVAARASAAELTPEACVGGWGPTALATWRKLGALHAARVGLAAGEGIDQLLQAHAIALQCENAQAVLRRLPATAAEPVALEEP